MQVSIVITLLAMFAILQICRAIPVRVQGNDIEVHSANLIRPIDNNINIPPSEIRNIIHLKGYPVKFSNSFIYPYGSPKSRINIPPSLRHIASGHGILPHPYTGPVIIPLPAPRPGDKNLIPPYPTTIGSSDESSSDSSDESINGSGEASTDEINEIMTTDNISLQSITTEPICITGTISTTEEPTTTVPIVSSSEKSSSEAPSTTTDDSNMASNSSQSLESLESADPSS